MIETELSAESCDAFLDRFYGLTDSVLRAVEIHTAYAWFTKPPLSDAREVGTATVMFSCRDRSTSEWTNVHLRFVDVVEGRIGKLGSSASSVISDGVKCVWSEGVCFASFDLWEGTVDVAMIRASAVYLAARRVSWWTSPYDR